jgi:hypothetical protein
MAVDFVLGACRQSAGMGGDGCFGRAGLAAIARGEMLCPRTPALRSAAPLKVDRTRRKCSQQAYSRTYAAKPLHTWRQRRFSESVKTRARELRSVFDVPWPSSSLARSPVRSLGGRCCCRRDASNPPLTGTNNLAQWVIRAWPLRRSAVSTGALCRARFLLSPH